MFARTTRGLHADRAGAMADACCELRMLDRLCAHRKHQDAGRRKYFLGAVSVIYGPVI